MGKKFPIIYDLFMKPLEKARFQQIRRELIKKAEGHVLEIGSGTGLNFPFYQNVDDVTAIEPNQYMIQQSEKNVEKAAVSINIIQASAEQLPFDDNTFDTVIGTLVFCTIPNIDNALNELKRVCKPGAKILLFEHIKMEQPLLAKLQDKLTPIWKKICDGCHLNRETVNHVQQLDFQIMEVKTYYKGLFVVIEIQNSK